MKTSLVIETGEARELHHFSVLFGYGVEAINPYLAFETIKTLTNEMTGLKLKIILLRPHKKLCSKLCLKWAYQL